MKILAQRTLRASFAIKQGRIFFIWVKVRRINHDGKHLFTIGGGHPALFNLAHRQFIEQILVGKSYLCRGSVNRVNSVKVGRQRHRFAGSNEFIAGKSKSSVIVHSFGNFFDRAISERKIVNLKCSMPVAGKINIFAIGGPIQVPDILIKIFRSISFNTSFDLKQVHPVFIRFITITFHTFPGNIFSIRRKNRRNIETQHAFGHVFCFSGFKKIKIEVRVC